MLSISLAALIALPLSVAAQDSLDNLDDPIPTIAYATDARRGTGGYKDDWGVLHAANARPLESKASDAIRFSTSPELGGTGMIFEARLNEEDQASVEVSYFSGSHRDWSRTGGMQFSVSADRYLEFAATIDKWLAVEVREGGDICTDGPSYVTERLLKKRQSWLAGYCSGNPNTEIAKVVADFLSGWVSDRALGYRRIDPPSRQEDEELE
jgi:hypothetical protein